VSTSRVFREPPRVVLEALGRTLLAHPYGFVLRDTLGGHPLDGGVPVFTIIGCSVLVGMLGARGRPPHVRSRQLMRTPRCCR
jgi:hypothetical protein